jgi:hypothetical protein
MTDRDLAVVTDADWGLLAKDKRPPRAGWDRTQDGALVPKSLSAGRLRGLAQFAVDLVSIGVGQELIQQTIGTLQLHDLFGGEEGWQATLEIEVTAFNFAFGLGGRSVAEGYPVEVKRGPQLSEGIGGVGEEQGMVVYVKPQWQAPGAKGPIQEVQVGQEGFGRIEPRTDVETGGVVQEVEQDVFMGLERQPVMGRGVILPERSPVLRLPSLDGFAHLFITGVRSQVVLNGPAPDAGSVGLEPKTAEQFARGPVVRTGRFGTEELAQQVGDADRPAWTVIASRVAGLPSLGFSTSAGAEVIAVESVKTSP